MQFIVAAEHKKKSEIALVMMRAVTTQLDIINNNGVNG
jgi:hypothetical protein